MHQQCNSLTEMGRRLIFLLYIAVFTIYLIACVVALARPGIEELAAACTSLLVLIGVRYAGYRWFEFHRLCKSFPSGCALDRVPEAVRAEVEALVAEFHAPETPWTRRVEIRHRLIELEETEPEIVDAYFNELKRVLAG